MAIKDPKEPLNVHERIARQHPPKQTDPKLCGKAISTKVRREGHTSGTRGVDDPAAHAQRIGKIKQRKKRNIGRV